MLWWLVFLKCWSRVSIIQIKRPLHKIWTDASGSKGIGGYYLDHFFAAHVPRWHRRKHINWKEMYAVLYAFLLWHSHWEHGEVLVYCDNQAVVKAINKRSIRGPTITPLQTLFLIAALFNVTISAVWIPTASNTIADALSRHDFKRLANLGIQYNHHIQRSEPPFPIQTLRQKLLSYSKTVSPTLQEETTMTQLPIIPSSPDRMAIHPFQQQPSQLCIGSPTFSNPSKSKLHKPMSEQLETIILSTNFLSSTTQSSIASLREGNVFTTKTPIENDSLSPKTSSSEWSPTFDNATSSLTMTSTSSPPSVLDSQDSYVQGNSLGSNGVLFRLLDFIYLDNMSPSIIAPAQLQSFSHRRKPTPLQKEPRSISPLQVPKSVLSQLSTIYSSDSQHIQQLPSSVATLDRSQGHILSRELRQLSSTSGSTPANSLAIHYEKVQRSQPIAKVSHALRSSFLVDGRAMQ